MLGIVGRAAANPAHPGQLKPIVNELGGGGGHSPIRTVVCENPSRSAVCETL